MYLGIRKWVFCAIYCSHCVKSLRIWSYSGPYFPAFGLNTERYKVPLRFQSECGKVRTRINLNTDNFYAMYLILLLFFFSQRRCSNSLHRIWSFPLKISSVNVAKSTGNCRFCHIYERNHSWKTSFCVLFNLTVLSNNLTDVL